jgi:hypothetical protein
LTNSNVDLLKYSRKINLRAEYLFIRQMERCRILWIFAATAKPIGQPVRLVLGEFKQFDAAGNVCASTAKENPDAIELRSHR